MAPIQYSQLTSSNGLNNVSTKTSSSSQSYQSSSSSAKSSSKSYSSSYKIVNGKIVDEFSNMSVSDEGASSSSEKGFVNGEQIINNSSNSSYNNHNSTGDLEDLKNQKNVKSLLDFEPLGLFPIIERGLFFQDGFFNDWQEQWEEAVKEILDKFNARLPNTDDFSSYRTLREKDLREENQANSLEIEGNNYKVSLIIMFVYITIVSYGLKKFYIPKRRQNELLSIL